MIKYVFLISILCLNNLNARTWVQFVNIIPRGQQPRIVYIDVEAQYQNRYSLRPQIAMPNIIRIAPHHTYQTLNVTDHLAAANMNVIQAQEQISRHNYRLDQILANLNQCVAVHQAPPAQGQPLNQQATANEGHVAACFAMLYRMLA